jgi:hypothetical protein
MTVRIPLKLAGSNLKQMSAAEITAIKNQVRHLYGTDPSVVISRVVSPGGNLGALNDTNLIAGAATSGQVSSYVTEANTPNTTTETDGQDRFFQTLTNTTEVADTGNIAFPVYSDDNNNIKSMSLTDVYDTFIYPAIDILTDGSDQPGTYRVGPAVAPGGSTALAGHTQQHEFAVFTDTRADTSNYTSAGIPEALDQAEAINRYYLYVTNNISAVSYTAPLFITDTDYHLQQYTTSNFDTILKNCVRHVASEDASGYKIRYRLNGAGNQKGAGMENTVLVNQTYVQYLASIDDYRTQKFPSGTAISTNTYYLNIYKA